MPDNPNLVKGPFYNVTDAQLHLGPCDLCGYAEDTEYISRATCQKCGRVLCYRCADMAVYSSLSDFHHLLYRTPEGAFVLLPENCPVCQEMRWWDLLTGQHAAAVPSSEAPLDPSIEPHPAHIQNHALWVGQVKAQLLIAARTVLAGQLSIIAGARLISQLGLQLAGLISDEDLRPFIAVNSETDSLPVGKERDYWSAEALVGKDHEIHAAETRYAPLIQSACRTLLEKYSKDPI